MNKDFNIGQTIRDLRLQRRLSGEELGKRAGLSQSKISRIETGSSVTAQADEIEKILNILEAPQPIRQQILLALGQPRLASFHRLKPTYLFHEPIERERSSQLIRGVTIGSIPLLLQTTEHRQAWLSHLELDAKELQVAMRETMRRQDLIWDRRRRFHFIMHEAGLYSTPADHTVQLGQLDRIDRFIGVRNVRVGIIPLEAGWPAVEISSFVLYDDRCVARLVADGDILTRGADDITLYIKLFGTLDRLAYYGDSARTLVRKAADYFG